MTEDKNLHLTFIQNVITRMNTNSFQLKGWSIAVFTAVTAVYTANKNWSIFLVTIIALVIFWILDAYYLQQERKFRGIYNDVSGVTDYPQQLKAFEMNPSKYTKHIDKKYSYKDSLFSNTIIFFYVPIIIINVFMMCFL